MNSHDFYNLLQGKIILAPITNGIYEYPDEFIKRYNESLEKLNSIATSANNQIEAMSLLRQEQFKYLYHNKPKENT